MGFGINLAKGAATTAANALTGGIAGGLVDGIFGLFSGGRKDKKQRQWQEMMMQKQWENELAMQEKQHGYNLEIGEKNQEYAKELSEIGYQQSLGLNQINYAQQNAMFDKQAEYNSAEKIKERLKKAGMNPALAFGGGATGTGGVSSGGGTGPGIGAGTAPGGAGPGTQAVMMGLQAKAIESQIDVNKATARKINAEATNTKADLPKKAAETENQWQGIELLKKQTIGEEARIRLTNMQTELTEAMREESWSNWEKAKAGIAEISRIMEKLDAEINGMNIDNEIKNDAREAIIGNYFADLRTKAQSIIESKAKVRLNEQQIELFRKNIKDIQSIITNRDMTEEKKRRAIDTEIDYTMYKMGLEDQQNIRQWIYEGIDAVSKLMPYGK